MKRKVLLLSLVLGLLACDKTDLVAELEESATFTSNNTCAKVFITNKVRTGPGKKGWFRNDWHSYKLAVNVRNSDGMSLNRETFERPTIGGEIVNGLIDYARVMVHYGNTLSEDVSYGAGVAQKGPGDKFSWSLGEVRLNSDLDSPTHLVSSTADLSCNAIHSIVVYNAAMKTRSSSATGYTKASIQSYKLAPSEDFANVTRKFANFMDRLSSVSSESALESIGAKASIATRSAMGEKVKISKSEVDSLVPGNELTSKQKEFAAKIAEDYLNN